MGFHCFAMKFPIYQFSCDFELILRHIWAFFEIFKYLLTDGDRSFYDFWLNFFVSENEIHNIEVPSSVNGSHNWNSSNEMMAKKMPMSLNNRIQSALRKLVDELGHFIIETDTLLRCGLFPNAKGIICVALISNMTEKHNCINSFHSQLLAFPYYMRIVRQELYFRKFSFQILPLWCLNSNQTDQSDSYSWFQSVDFGMRIFF